MSYSVESKFNSGSKTWEIALSGEVDIFVSSDFKDELIGYINQQPGSMEIDMDKLSYIDSTGLGAIVCVLKHVKSCNGEIALKNVKPNVLKLFKITSLDKIFKIEGGDDDDY